MDGLSIQDEIFAIRLLELARHAAPEGNRVQFVQACEDGRLRGFLERFPVVWERITDDPVRQGITSRHEYDSARVSYALQTAAFQELLGSQLDLAEVRHLWLGGLSLAHLLYQDISNREFQGMQLLVSPPDVEAVRSVLEGLGFRTEVPMGAGQRRAVRRWGRRENFIHDQTGLPLTLSWRLFSSWIGCDLVSFDGLWSRARQLSWEGLSDWQTLGAADTVLYLALNGFESGWSRMQHLLDLAVALEVLDYTWDRVRELAGPRAALLERAAEIAVRLLGTPHPQDLTFHFMDHDHALAAWLGWHRAKEALGPELLDARYWSCSASEALGLKFKAHLTPRTEDIAAVALPPALVGLYPALRLLRILGRSFKWRGWGKGTQKSEA